MSFALEEARLWRHVEGTAVSPPQLKAKEDDSEDRIRKDLCLGREDLGILEQYSQGSSKNRKDVYG